MLRTSSCPGWAVVYYYKNYEVHVVRKHNLSSSFIIWFKRKFNIHKILFHSTINIHGRIHILDRGIYLKMEVYYGTNLSVYKSLLCEQYPLLGVIYIWSWSHQLILLLQGEGCFMDFHSRKFSSPWKNK